MDLFTGVDVGSSEQVHNWACIQYSERGLVVAMHADSFHFLVANFKIPPYSPSESGNLVCLAGDVADHDTGIP